MAKEPQQQRSVERRGAIVSATLQIMIAEGPSAVSARRIATEAGVPVASITYYFDSVAAIMGEALVSGIENRNEEMVRTLRSALEANSTRGQALETLAQVLSNRDPRRVALRYELYGMAVRSQELAEKVAQANGLIYRGIEAVIALLGVSSRVTASFEVLLEGFATSSLTSPLDKESEVARIVDVMRRLVFSDLPEGLTMAEWSDLPLTTTAKD
jgi:DNA-binding transcriptional regulator YbjK